MRDGDVDERPLVSVIVPVYNVERQLDRCVSSIVGQRYDNLEIILVDDGSPDGCPAKCDAWAERDSRITVIHQKNGGLSAARNAGLDIMTGAYVAFVDSDDYVESDYISRMLDAAKKHDADMVVCSICHEDEHAVPSSRNHSIVECDTAISGREGLHYLGGDTAADYVTAWNKLYSAQLWQEIRFPAGKLHEDEFTTYKVMDRCKTVVVVPDKLYHYVQNDGSIMHTTYSIRNLDRLEAWAQRLRYYQSRRYVELYDLTFALITWDLPHTRALDWDSENVITRLKTIFTQLKPPSFDLLMHLQLRRAVAYFMLCWCPFLFCRIRYRAGE